MMAEIYIPRIRYPGSFVAGDNGFHIQGFFSRIQTEIVEAWLALQTFDGDADEYIPAEIQWQRSVELNRRAVSEARRRYESSIHLMEQIEVAELARQVKLEWALAAGKLPDGWAHTQAFAAAKGFISSLNRTHRLIAALQQFPESEAASKVGTALIDSALPDLKGVRDSNEHTEDRAMRRAFKKEIPVPALHPKLERVVSRDIWIESTLVNSTFLTPTAAGTMGSIEIASESLDVIVQAFQSVLDGVQHRPGFAYTWPTADRS